ncbi:uncharacterized protein PRCAT00002344001 [Priceomyces carsonii]|uniref:uncharacterized protein n=1 Tax=Priceomyces carsonii TaxID=28549 RepID=UPI002ED9BC77|nr:unnamed protein product [Priceomyces carsonii]
MSEQKILSPKLSSDAEKKLDPIVSSISSIREVEGNVVGFDLFEKAQEIEKEEIENEYKKIRAKIDRRILPLLCVTYTLQFLDKLSLNYASAYSLTEDLDLVGQRYSWVAAIFNFGYLFWALPSNYIIQKVPVAKYTGIMLAIWAVILIAHVGCRNYAGMLVVRFILGMFEAGISPSCMMICSMFYTRQEQPFRMCTFLSCNGIATMVGALLGYGLGHATSASIKPWKLIFLVIGLLNFVWSFVFFLICPDSPSTAKFLDEREKAILVERISKNNIGIKDKKFKKSHLVEASCDITVWMIALIGLCCGIINGGVSNFSSSLIKGYGFSGLTATALQLPTGAIEFVVVFTAGIIAISVKNTRCIIFVLLCVPGLAGLIGIHAGNLDHKWALVGCTWLQFIIGGPVILSWIFLTGNIGGHSKRTIANGLWFTFYAAGNIVGANIFYAREAPKYRSAMIGLMTCYCGMMAIGILYRLILMRRNLNRDKEQGGYSEEIAQQAVIDGFKDCTDFENRGFRYAL